jgi:radical SAM protein with 4Fe4S-binding SPASM domain
LSFEYIKKLLDDLSKMGCLTVNISGGEPAAFPELTRDIGSYAKEKKFENISVSTCGYGLNEKILKEWKKAGITYLNLSLDTMDEELQDRISEKKGAWKEAINACEIACKIGLQVRINATCYQEAIKTIEELAEFAKRVGAYKVRFNPLIPSAQLPPVHPEIMKDVVKRVKILEKNGYSVYTPLEPDDELPEILICAAGITKAVVEVDGSVGGCQFMGNYPNPAGNILEKSFIEIWTKGNWDYFRGDLLEREMPLPCAKCKDRIYCISYCLAYAHSLWGDAKKKGKIKCPWKNS